jgi:hypothetical protein
MQYVGTSDGQAAKAAQAALMRLYQFGVRLTCPETYEIEVRHRSMLIA